MRQITFEKSRTPCNFATFQGLQSKKTIKNLKYTNYFGFGLIRIRIRRKRRSDSISGYRVMLLVPPEFDKSTWRWNPSYINPSSALISQFVSNFARALRSNPQCFSSSSHREPQLRSRRSKELSDRHGLQIKAWRFQER